jgi:hypothetical protein
MEHMNINIFWSKCYAACCNVILFRVFFLWLDWKDSKKKSLPETLRKTAIEMQFVYTDLPTCRMLTNTLSFSHYYLLQQKIVYSLVAVH